MHSKSFIGLLFTVLLLTCVRSGVASPGAGPAIAAVQPAGNKTFLTHQEALALAFPKCEVKRTTAFLTKTQVDAIAKAAQTTFTSTVVYPYVATKKGKLVGTAYFDTHRVRTLKETVMIVVDPKGQVSRVELLAFGEPKQYIPSKKWYTQIVGQKLSSKLKLNQNVRNMTGATMTARASVNCARRMLALHAELSKPKPKPKVDKKEVVAKGPKPSPKKKEVVTKPKTTPK